MFFACYNSAYIFANIASVTGDKQGGVLQLYQADVGPIDDQGPFMIKRVPIMSKVPQATGFNPVKKLARFHAHCKIVLII